MLYGEQAQTSIAQENPGDAPGHESTSGAHGDSRIVVSRGDASLRFLKSHSVFVVSGDEYVRQCIRCALLEQGISPIVFESAAEYLACGKADTPACIILDVVLPDMSGFDLQRRLAGTCPPIIFATRRAEVACSVRAMKEGAFDFLTVPFEAHALMCSVHAALELDKVSRPQREEIIGMRGRFDRLTPRERQVMRLIAGGRANKQVACELGISEVTAQIHRGRIRQKMNVASVAELVRVAIRLGIAPADASGPMLESGGSVGCMTRLRTQAALPL